MSTLGTPHRPNPPTASDEPLTIPTTASAGLATTLSMALLSDGSGKGCKVLRRLWGEDLGGMRDAAPLTLVPSKHTVTAGQRPKLQIQPGPGRPTTGGSFHQRD